MRMKQHVRLWDPSIDGRWRNPGPGGSIPLLNVLRRAVPEAEFVLWGCEDHEQSRIHGASESVAISELERMIVTQALLLQDLGNRQ